MIACSSPGQDVEITAEREIADVYITSIIEDDYNTYSSLKYNCNECQDDFLSQKSTVQAIDNLQYKNEKETYGSTDVHYEGQIADQNANLDITVKELKGELKIMGFGYYIPSSAILPLSKDTLSLLKSFSYNQVIFEDTNEELESLSEGDVLIFGITEYTPQGALLKIKSITKSQDMVSIQG